MMEKWAYNRNQRTFHSMVVTALVEHVQKMRLDWALLEASRQPWDDEDEALLIGGDDGYDDDDTNSEANDTDDETDDDIENDDDTDHAPAPATRRPLPKRRAGAPPTTNLGDATVWIDGQRRSARHQPTLGSVFENGRRRSARFL
jgi:hypothetical protein